MANTAKTAREAMTPGAECVGENDTVSTAAQRLAELGVGSMPICGEDNRLKGMITDRDIVVKVIAKGDDPQSVTVGSLAEGKPVTIGADDSLDEALRTMSEHQVRRLPVIDGHDLVGMLSQADLARTMPDEAAGDLVRAISEG
jgi:CBS domain-containing protein